MFKADSNKGFIYIHRQIEDSLLWAFKPFSKGQAWIDLLLCTNHKSGFITTKNGMIVNIERGECGYSVLAFADRWGWSRGKVQRYFDWLSAQKMIQQKIVSNHSVIKVINYNDYQNKTINDTINEQQTEQQTDTNNNVNNVNNINIYGAEKNKKFDPYFNNPVTDKFKSEYNKIYKSKCYLDNYKINKLLEISSENPNFTEKLPEILNKFSKLKFFKGEKATKPTLKWLILEGGWAGILNGEYDQFIDKPAPELKKDWTTNELLTCDTSIYDDKEVDGWSL